MSEGRRKRGHDGGGEVTAGVSVQQQAKNSIIGLEFTDGFNLCYFHRSTLVNAGGYFAAYFGDNGLVAVPSHTDEHGREIYFIEREGELFRRYIMPFILKRTLVKLSSFQKDPELWRELREEAAFYALDDLSEMLHVTHSCPWTIGDDRGVLYWLGTSKGELEYENPHAIGKVSVHVGGVADMTNAAKNEILANDDLPRQCLALAYTPESRQALVQYRPAVKGIVEQNGNRTISIDTLSRCYSLGCGLSRHRIPTIVDLQGVKVRLSAYSLRHDGCGMSDWDLEGSPDGETWTVLHEARNDPFRVEFREQSIVMQQLSSDFDLCSSSIEQVAVAQEFVERELRHTWQITPPSGVFCRYFRIIGVGPDYEHGENASTCLHGVGLELYGDIHEE